MRRLPVDALLLVVAAAIVAAVLLPARGHAQTAITSVTMVAIAVLFVLYGARLSPREMLSGLTRWRLHILILVCTFIVFPVIGVLGRPLFLLLVSQQIYTGLLYLCVVASTTLSSVAFTSIARGSVADAVIGASASNLLGIVLTPALVLLVVHGGGQERVDSSVIVDISLQLLLPYLLGLALRPLLARWLTRHGQKVKLLERAAIGLVVYTAFITGADEHNAHVSVWTIGAVVLCCMLLFTVMLGITTGLGATFRFAREERIVLQFCGTQKSLATGLPMALVMFSPQLIAFVVLPLVVYYVVQMVAGSRHAARHARHQPVADGARAT